MDSSQRALQTNGNLFSSLEFLFEFLAVNRKIFKRIERCEYWSKWNVLYINRYIIHFTSIALDKLYKLMWSLLQISESFFELASYNFFEVIVALGLCKRGGGGIGAEQHAF